MFTTFISLLHVSFKISKNPFSILTYSIGLLTEKHDFEARSFLCNLSLSTPTSPALHKYPCWSALLLRMAIKELQYQYFVRSLLLEPEPYLALALCALSMYNTIHWYQETSLQFQKRSCSSILLRSHIANGS